MYDEALELLVVFQLCQEQDRGPNTTLPCLQGRCYFANKGVGQLTYKGVLHEGTPLQASDKYHSFQPCFLTTNHSNSTCPQDTFWFLLIRELPISTPLQANRLLPYKQGYVVVVCVSLILGEQEQIMKLSPMNDNSQLFQIQQIADDIFQELTIKYLLI
ncbi:Hypothetical_protein [Hexamita inflata]|uniref:Hypothetical_protein n=1 Tax=Hexamita inflata TaxID=28002 RepID=A0AA86UPR6_9EUKA|nr:Hypothetical protein HINF_LOCUS34188 [Hexamita inflata]CAI9946552.1 Hypothetical protein HINF_LOCUS34197 [Hexamita inflata]